MRVVLGLSFIKLKIVRISGDDKIIISAFLLHRKKGEDYFLNIRLFI